MSVLSIVVGYLSIPLIAASTWFMLRSLRRAGPLRPASLIASMAAGVLVLIAYVAVLRMAPHGALSWPLFFLGLGLGVWSSWATRLEVADDRVLIRRSLWYVAVWGGTLAFTQSLAVSAGPATAAWGVATVYFSTGMSLGAGTTLLLRRHDLLERLRRHVAAESVSAGTGAPREEGASVAPPSDSSTPSRGAPAGDRGRPASRGCSVCGFSPGHDVVFCPRCGTRIVEP
jgi:hypothetical protein